MRASAPVLVAGLLLTGHAAAQSPAERGSLAFIVENDVFASTDRNYTSGLKLSYVSGLRTEPGPTRWLAGALLGAGAEDRVRFGLAVGHSIFTPEDIDTAEPLPDQHPYAGWLYGGFSLLVESESTLDTLVLELGVVGPDAGGERVQKNVHEIIDSDEPLGWDNQLRNEFGGVLTYDRKWRALATWEGLGLGADFTPNAGFSLGNVLTQATLGLTLRLGNDLRNDFGPPRVRPSLAGSGLLTPRDRFSWYVFAGVAGRAVAYNIFLDGNTSRDSLEVDREPLVADFQGGLVVQVGRLQIGFTGVTRTREFESQDEDQVFGAISISGKL